MTSNATSQRQYYVVPGKLCRSTTNDLAIFANCCFMQHIATRLLSTWNF